MTEGGLQAEMDLAGLLDSAPQVITRVDLDGTILYASAAAAEILGRTPEELTGTRGLDLLEPADVEEATARLERIRTGAHGAEERITARVRHPDGHAAWVDIHSRLVADPLTGEKSIISVTRPSGNEVEAQGALLRIEERFRELVEWLPAVVYEAEPGPDGAFLYVSPQSEDMLGFRPEEWLTDRHLWLERIPPEDRAGVVAAERDLEQTARGGDRRIATDYRMRHRDGRIVWIRDVSRLCKTRTGPGFRRGVLLDVTAEYSAQAALAGAHEHHRRMVEGLPACAYRAEPRAMGRWAYVSPEIENLLGYKQQEWHADPTLWRASLHADDRDWVEREEDRHAAAQPGTEFVLEYRLRHRTGRLVWVRDRAVVTEGPEGEPMIDGILTDITAERAAEAGAELVADVYRLTCVDCGAIWAGDGIERCRECGRENIEAVSLNSVLRDLATSRRQVEGLLDGIQKHLEALRTNLHSVSSRLRADEADR